MRFRILANAFVWSCDILFFPAEEGGKPLDVKEVISYLTSEGYHEYDTTNAGGVPFPIRYSVQYSR